MNDLGCTKAELELILRRQRQELGSTKRRNKRLVKANEFLLSENIRLDRENRELHETVVLSKADAAVELGLAQEKKAKTWSKSDIHFWYFGDYTEFTEEDRKSEKFKLFCERYAIFYDKLAD